MGGRACAPARDRQEGIRFVFVVSAPWFVFCFLLNKKKKCVEVNIDHESADREREQKQDSGGRKGSPLCLQKLPSRNPAPWAARDICFPGGLFEYIVEASHLSKGFRGRRQDLQSLPCRSPSRELRVSQVLVFLRKNGPIMQSWLRPPDCRGHIKSDSDANAL